MTGCLPAGVRAAPLRVATWLAIAGALAGCASTTAASGTHAGHHDGAAARPGTSTPGHAGSAAGSARNRRSPVSGQPVSSIGVFTAGPARLARELAAAELAIRDGQQPAAVLARQSLVVQLACLRLAIHPGWAATAIGALPSAGRNAAAAAAAADLAATADLVALTPPAARPPPWRIIPARGLATLRADYREAQAATGVGWPYLAAINFVETDFGAIIGPSSAGAQGPMQFMPATWASYGRGSIYRPRDAIMAAARFLLAHGAPGHIRAALFSYNPSWRYVDAVLRYASRIRASTRALAGYYRYHVIYRMARGWFLLPPGYGSRRGVHAIKLRL